MMHTVHLHSAAKDCFGGPFRFDVQTPAQAARALFQIAGFERFLRGHDWKVIRCKGPLHLQIGEEELCLRFGNDEDLHLVPITAGASKGKGFGKIAVGVAIAIAAVALSVPTGGGSIALGATAFSVGGYAVSFGSIALAGASIALGGVSQLLAKSPQVKGYSNREGTTADAKPSFLFNGPVNVVSQGATIPVICGLKVRTGSFVISAGISTETFVPA